MVFTSTKSEANELALNAVLKQVCVHHCYYIICIIRSLLVLNWHCVNKNTSTSAQNRGWKLVGHVGIIIIDCYWLPHWRCTVNVTVKFAHSYAHQKLTCDRPLF